MYFYRFSLEMCVTVFLSYSVVWNEGQSEWQVTSIILCYTALLYAQLGGGY